MHCTRMCQVEFIGGPYDGFKQIVSVSPAELGKLVSIPVNGNTLRMVEGEASGPKRPASSVAVYEREFANQIHRYRFLGATTAKTVHLEHWLG